MNRGAETRQIVDRLLRENRKDPQALLLRAGIELEDGRPDLALPYLREAQQIDPDSPFVYMQLARVYLMRGDVRLAEKALENSLTRDPGYLPAQIVLAQLQLRKGQPDRAIRDLQKALEQKPGVVEPYLVLAQAYALKGEFHLAEESLSRWVGGAPSLPDRAAILRVLAWVKLRRGRALEARNIVRRSLDWEPRSREGLYLLGLTYLAAKEPDQGLTTLEDHLRGCSDWAAGYEVLGTLSLQAGKTDSAVAAYQRALAFDGLSIQALLGLGEAFGLQGKLDLARSYTEKAAAKEPQNVFVHLRLGQLAEMSGDWNGAITAYKKVVDLDSDHAIAKNNLAWLYAEHGGNLDVALRLAQEARQAKPDDSRVADTLGWICVKKGLYKTGIAYLTESLKKNPDNPVYHFHVGIACYKLGMVTEAKVRLETALRLTPNFAGAQQARQILRIISGD